MLEYDPTLFPVSIPSHLLDDTIDGLSVPSMLQNKFDQQGIFKLSQLQGLDVSAFLSWRGFGAKCLVALSSFLCDVRTGSPSRPKNSDFDRLTIGQLPPDVLNFPFSKFNLPTILKTRFGKQFRIESVRDFIERYESGVLSRPGIGQRTIELIFTEMQILVRDGITAYLTQITLDNQNFLRLIALAKESLPHREQIILDHRFVPVDGDFQTLETIARQVGLTRERIRQLEKALVKKFQSGNLRELGWAIRRNVLRLFPSGSEEFTFDEFMSKDFFQGCAPTGAKVPAAVIFLDRVFYSTFRVSKTKIGLNENTVRRIFT